MLLPCSARSACESMWGSSDDHCGGVPLSQETIGVVFGSLLQLFGGFLRIFVAGSRVSHAIFLFLIFGGILFI